MTDPRVLRHRTDYRAHRAQAYPAIGDQLDAILKGLAAYHRGEPLPPETVALLSAWQAVKARFPKP